MPVPRFDSQFNELAQLLGIINDRSTNSSSSLSNRSGSTKSSSSVKICSNLRRNRSQSQSKRSVKFCDQIAAQFSSDSSFEETLKRCISLPSLQEKNQKIPISPNGINFNAICRFWDDQPHLIRLPKNLNNSFNCIMGDCCGGGDSSTIPNEFRGNLKRSLSNRSDLFSNRSDSFSNGNDLFSKDNYSNGNYSFSNRSDLSLNGNYSNGNYSDGNYYFSNGNDLYSNGSDLYSNVTDVSRISRSPRKKLTEPKVEIRPPPSAEIENRDAKSSAFSSSASAVARPQFYFCNRRNFQPQQQKQRPPPVVVNYRPKLRNCPKPLPASISFENSISSCNQKNFGRPLPSHDPPVRLRPSKKPPLPPICRRSAKKEEMETFSYNKSNKASGEKSKHEPTRRKKEPVGSCNNLSVTFASSTSFPPSSSSTSASSSSSFTSSFASSTGPSATSANPNPLESVADKFEEQIWRQTFVAPQLKRTKSSPAIADQKFQENEEKLEEEEEFVWLIDENLRNFSSNSKKKPTKMNTGVNKVIPPPPPAPGPPGPEPPEISPVLTTFSSSSINSPTNRSNSNGEAQIFSNRFSKNDSQKFSLNSHRNFNHGNSRTHGISRTPVYVKEWRRYQPRNGGISVSEAISTRIHQRSPVTVIKATVEIQT